MKSVQNVKEIDHEGRTRYVMDRMVLGKWIRQCLVITKIEEQHRHGVAMRLRRARESLRRSCEFVRAHPPVSRTA